jgi:hypothetical protein
VPAGDESLTPTDASVSNETLSPAHTADLQRIITHAEEQSGLAFSVFIGSWSDGRVGVLRKLAALQQPERTVLIAVNPAERVLEIVTGRLARIALDDRACELAAMSMTSSFAAGDLVGGIRDGVAVLAEHGRRSTVLWVDQP